MTVEFKLPELGENIEEGDVTAILVKAGDTVAVDQSVVEMETGKANIEIPINVAGVVKQVHITEGMKAKVGQVIMTIEASDEAPAPKEEEAKPEAPKAETTAAAPAAPAPAQKPAVAPPPPPPPRPAADPSQSETLAPASPSTRKFAREVGININEVTGSGPGGRVSDEDVKAYARATRARVSEGGGGGPIVAPLPDFTKWGDVETESLSNVRAATAQAMAVSWSNIPHVTIHESVDITTIEKLRKDSKPKAEATGAKLTLTAFLIKILAAALKANPKFNTSIDMENKALIQKKYVNVGIAMDTDRGLVVPVMRDVDRKNVLEVAKELGELADRAQARKIPPEEMQGGSITITNIGGIGGSFFTPIVNYPEVAILGVGRGSIQPVQVNGMFQPRMILPLSLSFDHRVIDGADGARFLKWIADIIKDPTSLSLEG